MGSMQDISGMPERIHSMCVMLLYLQAIVVWVLFFSFCSIKITFL